MTADEYLADMQGQLSDLWSTIPNDYKEGVKITSECLSEFLKLAEQGQDVSEDLKDIHAQVLNWKFAAGARFQSAFWATAEKVATTIGTAALSALKKSIGLP